MAATCWHTENTIQNALRTDRPEGSCGEVLIELSSRESKGRTYYTVEAMLPPEDDDIDGGWLNSPDGPNHGG